MSGTPSKDDPTWKGLVDLSGFVHTEGRDIQALESDLLALFSKSADGVTQPSVAEILKKIVADVAIAALDLFNAAADKYLNFVTLVIDLIVDLLSKTIRIPVFSDILEDELGLKAEASVLQLMCVIPGVAATYGYKLSKGHAPFKAGGGSVYDKIHNANSWTELQQNFGQTSARITLDPASQALLFEVFYVAGSLMTTINGILLVVDEEAEGTTSTVLGVVSSITSVLASISLGMGALFKMPAQIQNDVVADFASILTKIRLLSTLGLGIASQVFGPEFDYVKSTAKALLAVIAMLPQAWRIIEIEAEVVKTRSPPDVRGALGIADSIQRMSGGLASVAAFAALIDEDEQTKQLFVLVQAVLVLIAAELQLAEAVVEGVFDT